jgi:hypothetical protein
MNKDNKNTEVDNTDKKLHISDVSDSLFDRLKEVIIEYCSLTDDSSIDTELEYHIKRYETYIHRTKTGFQL